MFRVEPISRHGERDCVTVGEARIGRAWGGAMSGTESELGVDEVDQVAVAKRAADYVGAVMEAVDSLPVVFAQRRTHRRVSRFTMPGNRQLTQLFVRRQLTVTLSRLKSATGLTETAASGQSANAGRLGVLVDAAGAKGSAVVPVVIVLGTIGVMVSLLSIVLPNLRQEADLLGSLPRVVALDGAAVASSATAFDENPAVFSPADLEGVVTALGLAALVVFGLFAVLAGSAHAAAAILDDPWRYDRTKAFRPSIRRGPVPTQQAAFGIRPQRIHTPVAADLIRNGALYLVLITWVLLPNIQDFADEESEFVAYFRVGAAQLVWAAVLVLFPGALLVAYLVVRHRRSSAGCAAPPPKEWRVGMAALMALLTGLSFVAAVTGMAGARLTAGPDLSVLPGFSSLSDEEIDSLLSEPFDSLTDEEYDALTDEEYDALLNETFVEQVYMSAEDRERFDDIDDLTVQSFSWYGADVASSDGAVTVEVLVTEQLTAPVFLGADIDAEEIDRLRGSAAKSRESESRPTVWISTGLAATLDPAQGDLIDLTFFEGPTVEARASTVFDTPGTDDPVVVLDVADFPEGAGPLLIDEFFLRATDGPLRNGGAAMTQIDRIVDDMNGVKEDLRVEFAYDRTQALIWALLVPFAGLATIVIAFGRPRKWRSDKRLAPPATREGPGLPPPELPNSSG